MDGSLASPTSSSRCPSHSRSPRPDVTSIGPSPCRSTLAATSSSTASSSVLVTGASCTTADFIWTRPATLAVAILPTPGQGFSDIAETPGIGELPYPGLGGWTPGMTAALCPRRCRPARTRPVRPGHSHPLPHDRKARGRSFEHRSFRRQEAHHAEHGGLYDLLEQDRHPPGEKRHKIIVSSWVKSDVHLYTVVPHAHYLCREFRLAATLPDGTSQPLLWIEDWDLDWQDQYRYLKPVRLPKGTLLTLAVYFDNSDGNPAIPISRPSASAIGLGTDDEMCACHFEFLPDDPSGYSAYPDEVARSDSDAAQDARRRQGLVFTRSARSTHLPGSQQSRVSNHGSRALERVSKPWRAPSTTINRCGTPALIERCLPSAPTGPEAPTASSVP